VHVVRGEVRLVRAGDAVRWTAINAEWHTRISDVMVHRVNAVSASYDAWVACHPLYRAWIGPDCSQLVVTDEPVDCMACIAAGCEP
jgi:hypothetical protein